MSPLLSAHSQTIWQTQTPRELQGRVFSVRRPIAQCTLPVGALSAGSFAVTVLVVDSIGIRDAEPPLQPAGGGSATNGT
jgi:hypothetical protein